MVAIKRNPHIFLERIRDGKQLPPVPLVWLGAPSSSLDLLERPDPGATSDTQALSFDLERCPVAVREGHRQLGSLRLELVSTRPGPPVVAVGLAGEPTNTP